MDDVIKSITARYGKRGREEEFSFAGREALDDIDKTLEELNMTKSDLETYKNNAAASADAASGSAEAAAGSAAEAADSATAAAGSATAASKSVVDASEWTSKAADAASNASGFTELAESWAHGKTGAREGESTNNAEYFAEQASDSKDAAWASATNAEKSATAASDSATAAAGSATEAAGYAETAKGYAESDYAKTAESWAVGGTGTRTGEDTDNAKYYYDKIKDTDVGDLAELEKMIEQNLNSVNHDQKTYPAFVADRLANVDDLDACTTNGIYQFTATATNNPVNAIGMVLVLNSTGSGETGYIAQYAWAASDAHTVYARDDHGGTWGAWEQVGADGSVITDITKRLTTAESNITSQGTRLSSAESNITSQGTRLSSAESNISKLDSGKADKATTLAGYGITDGATKAELALKADQSGLDVTYAMAKNLSDNFGLLSTTPMYFGCDGTRSLDGFETGIQLLNGSILGISDWFLVIGAGTTGTGMQVAFGLSSNSLIKRYASGGSINGWVRLI